MNRIDTNGKNTFDVGDEAYIIESNRSVRKVTIIKISRDFCTVRFADTDGAIAVRVSRLYGITAKETNSCSQTGRTSSST